MYATAAMLEIFQQYIANMADNLDRVAAGPPHLALVNLHAIERDCRGAIEFIALIRREQAETAAAIVAERRAA